MIYLKNNTETQAIYIPRQTVLGGGYIPSTKAYDKGYNDGLEDGKEQQKGKLSNLNVTENGQYEREDGWNVVNVDVPDLNGSYNEGYEQGKTDGIGEQKGKLESISITENGVYSKEDGYNHIEVNVPSYEEGQADMAAKARILNVTKNGNYLSKFSESIIPTTITGVYADNTEFYSYALISNIIYSTGIIPNQNTRLEFWFKPYGTEYESWEIIIGSQRGDDTTDTFQVRRYSSSTNFVAEIGTSEVSFTMSENEWHHIIMSVADGFVLDGTKIGDFTENMTESNTPLQIGGSINFNGQRTEEGYYGMIKIDDTIIIPTENGFKNVTTDQILQILKDGSYTYTENLPIYAEGELYKTINVNVPDLNGSYDEGKTDGINEQKSKLETINITKNGTYNREDGYNKIIVKVPDLNGDYNEGYDQGQADIAENAIVLNVTENGVYKTKFSDPIMPTLVTGVYADGTEFYNYAELKGKVFNTNIPTTMNSRIELWYKGDNTLAGDAYNVIIGANYMGDSIAFEVIYNLFSNTEVSGRIGSTYLNTNWDENIWHHIILSKNDGFIVDGVKIGDMQSASYTSNGNFLINANSYNNQRNANGYFGMIKIDDVVIIPTANGFLNTNTGELLEVVQDGDYIFTKNLPTYGEGEIYKTINVNVPQEAVSCNLINPIVFSKEAGNTINAENVQIPTFVYEGNQYYNVSSFNLADIEEFKIHILFKPNNSGDSEPINVFGCEDTDWDNTTFGARIYQGQIYFRMSGEDVAYTYTENAWYDVEMGYNTTKRWVIVNGETLLDAEYVSFNRPSQTLMIGAINSGGNALRPFYGKIAAIYINSNGNQVYLLPKEDGTMGVYWNDRTNRRNTISGDNNARFENDYISGDGMKSITWLGNLEDKWVIPSMNDRDSNGFIVVRPSEGYNGLYRTVINPQTIYNEGVEAGSQAQDTKWVTPSTNDVDNNGYIVIRPDDGYVAMKRVAINVSTIKSEWTTIGENSIKNYYWCPLTVSDGGIGERAKYFSLADEQTVYDENDVLIDRNNMFYLPTANNLNEFRLTKKAVKIVFPFKNEDAQHIGNLYLNDDVEQFACADKNLSSLSIIEVGVNMARFTLSNCNLLNLNKIVVHSNNNCDVTLTHNVKSTGTLYVNESNQFKNNWINALPSGWTVEYI